jgi:hypothetical protein
LSDCEFGANHSLFHGCHDPFRRLVVVRSGRRDNNRGILQRINPHRISHSNLPPQIGGKLDEHEDDGLSALRTVFRLGVVLVAADSEAVVEMPVY